MTLCRKNLVKKYINEDPAALRRHDRQQQFVRDRGESEAGRDLQSCGPVRIREVTAQLVALADLQRALVRRRAVA